MSETNVKDGNKVDLSDDVLGAVETLEKGVDKANKASAKASTDITALTGQVTELTEKLGQAESAMALASRNRSTVTESTTEREAKLRYVRQCYIGTEEALQGKSEDEVLALHAPLVEARNVYLRAGQRKFSDINPSAMSKEALGVGTVAYGANGFNITDDVLENVIPVLRKQGSLRGWANVRTATSPIVRVPYKHGVTQTHWGGENADLTQTTPLPDTFETEYRLFNLFSTFVTTRDAIDYSPTNVVADIGDDISMSRLVEESEAHLFGNGRKQPKGLLLAEKEVVDVGDVANATTEIGTILTVKTGVANKLGDTANDASVDADNYGDNVLRTVANTIHPRYKGNFAWMMNSAVFDLVLRMRDKDGRLFFNRDLIGAGDVDTLLNRPVIINENMPHANDSSRPWQIVGGDFNQGFSISDFPGIITIFDEITGKNQNEVQLTSMLRTGAGLSDANALRIISFVE